MHLSIKKVPDIIENFVVIIGSILLISIVTISVIARYWFAYGVAWAPEINQILYLWLSFFAVSWAMRDKGIISVEVADLVLKKKGRLRVSMIRHVFEILLYALITYSAFNAVATAYRTGDLTPYLRLPNWVANLGLFIGITFAMFRTVVRVSAEVKVLRQMT